MASKPEAPRRRNKSTPFGELMGEIMDPALRKRGFASRELLANWHAMAPEIYRQCTFPDKLAWPRGGGAEGGVLYLRCAEAQRLAVTHDAALIAGAVNRYFGYVLVKAVKLSAQPFTPGSGRSTEKGDEPDAQVRTAVETEVADIPDEALRNSLAVLGMGLRRRGR